MTEHEGVVGGARPLGDGKAQVEAALDQVVTDFGRMLSRKPDRLRNLLNDVLGTNASRVAPEIDAVVAAAASGLPDMVLSGESTDEGYERLVGDGVEPGLAGWALASWTRTLRADGPAPPTLVPPDPVTVAPPLDGASNAAPPEDLTVAPSPPVEATVGTPLDEAGLTPLGTPLPPPPLPAPPAPEDATVPRARRRVALLAGGAVTLLLLSAAAAAALTENGEDEAVAAWVTTADGSSAAIVPENQSSSTPSVAPTTSVVPTATVTSAEMEMGDDLQATRTLTLVGDTLTVSVTYENLGATPFDGKITEVVPPALIERDATMSPKPDSRLREGHAYTYDLTLDVGKSFDFEGRFEGVNSEWTEKNLNDVLAQFVGARFAWFVGGPGDHVPPATRITAPGPGFSTQSGSVTVTGKTEPTATVKVNDTVVEVADDGTFTTVISLVVGINPITVTATDGNGNVKTVKQTVTRTAPPSDPGPSDPGPSDPGPSDPGPSDPGPSDPGPIDPGPIDPEPKPKPEPKPANRAPVVNCGNIYLPVSGQYGWYYFQVKESCFSDPDGDTLTTKAQIQSGGGSLATACDGKYYRWCWTYYPPAGWNGSAYQVLIYVWATDSHGAKTAQSVAVTLCLNC